MSDDQRKRAEKDREESQPGAEGGEDGSKDVPPGVPNEDSSELGDTDQHSGANA